MTYMSPTDAQAILEGAEAFDLPIDVGYRRALETIAAMRTEYCAQYQMIPGGQWHQVSQWDEDSNPYSTGYSPSDHERIATRYVLDLD